MSDNVSFQTGDPATPPSATVVATDDIGGIQYQRVKVVWGPDGTATDADVASGAALPVQVRDSSGTELGTVTDPLRVDPTGATFQPVTDGGGSLTVDNAGIFAVQASQSGTWNVGTVATITNVVHVDDNGASLTVDGTVAATQSGTWNITNISGTISLPTGAATAANQTAVQGTAGSAVPSKGLLVQGSDGTNARNLSTTTGGVLKVDLSGTAANATAVKVDGSAVTQPVSNAGTFAVQAAPSLKTTSSLTNANVSISSSGENTVVSGTASQTIRVFRGSFTAASSVTLTVKNAAAGTTLATIPLPANGSFAFDTFDSGEPLWVTASGGAFIISLSAAVSVSGFVQYTKS